MLRILFFLSICLLIYIPHTSIQDVSISNNNNNNQQNPLSKRIIPTTNKNIHPIEKFIQWLTEQQYQYETAYYALALNNMFPNFAKLFHERSESKYDIIKDLIRLCQILNLDIDLQFIASNFVNRPLRYLSPDNINKTNFAQFLSDLKSDECDRSFTKITNVYEDLTNISAPLQMYFKKKIYTKQSLICKLTADLFAQVDRFIDANSIERSIPFSLMFFDSRMNSMIPK